MKHHEIARKLRRAPKSLTRDEAFRRAIRSIPKGKVATYGQVAAAAGYPLYHRHVAQLLQKSGGTLPWQRVVGAGGAMRATGWRATAIGGNKAIANPTALPQAFARRV